MIFSTSIFSQTFPAPSSCTSKDLELLSATLPPPGSDACACGGTRTLMLGIINKTGSTRTSFALWGTLVRYDANNTEISRGPITACAGPIPKNVTSILASATTVSVNCGESLEIVYLYLAWTSASPNETCPVLQANPSTINPKCGTLPSIPVGLGVNANTTPTNASCTSTGQIVVSPYGGKAPYSVTLGSDTRTNIAAGGPTTFTGLGAGTYNCTITDANNCSISKSRTLTQPDAVSTPAATVSQQTTCTISLGTVSVTSPDAAVTYTLNQGNTVSYTAANGVFNSVAPGTYTLKASKGSCSATGNNVTINDQPPTPAKPTIIITALPSLCDNTGGSIKICNPVTGYTYKKVGAQSGVTAGVSDVVFSGLAAGSNPSFIVTSDQGCSSPATSCSDAVQTCPNNQAGAANVSGSSMEQTRITTQQINMPGSKIGVKAFPNPFNDKIRFVINVPASGKGSLEIFNTLGQKVKTVHQGLMSEGTQTFDFSVPMAQRSTLVYVLRLNGKQVTGKLLNSNK